MVNALKVSGPEQGPKPASYNPCRGMLNSAASRGGCRDHPRAARRAATAGASRWEFLASMLGLLLLLACVYLLLQDRNSAPHTSQESGTEGSSIRSPGEVVPALARRSVRGETPLTADPGPARIVRLLTVDQLTGLAVADVPLFRVTGDGSHPLGHTDAHGTLEASLPLDRECAITAIPEGYCTWSGIVDDATGDQLVIELVAGVRIHGRVIDTDGSSVGAGFTVAAWNAGIALRLQDVQRWFDGGDAPFRTAVTDSEGKFVLTGLQDEVQYEVAAGSGGYLAREVRASPGGEEVTLVALPVYGCTLRVRLEDGSMPQLRMPFPGVTASFQENIAEDTLYTRDPRLLLAGFDLRQHCEDPNYDQPFLFTRPGREPEIGPISCEVSLPGHHYLLTQVFPSRLDAGIIRHDVRLSPAAPGAGTLEFRFRAFTPANPAGRNGDQPAGYLHITDMEGRPFEYEVSSFHEPVVLPQFPFGSYQYRFVLFNRFADDDRWAGAIEHSSSNTVQELDLGELSMISVDLNSTVAADYLGRAVLSISRAPKGASAIYHFSSPPYSLEGIPTGDYQITLLWPNSAKESTSHSVEVRLEPRASQAIAFNVPRGPF